MNELQKLRGNALGTNMALMNAVRALIRTHPQPLELAKALNQSREEGLAPLLLSKDKTDSAVAAYQDTWEAMIHWANTPHS